MKQNIKLVILALIVLVQNTSFSTNFTNIVGLVYSNVVIKGCQPDGIRVIHSKGVAFIPFESLPESVSMEYGYDPESKKAYLASREKAYRQSRALELIRKSKLKATIEIIQITGDGALASGFYMKDVEHMETEYKIRTRTVLAGPGQPGVISERVPVREIKKVGRERVSLGRMVYVAGLPQNLVDGNWYSTFLYPCGRYQYINTLGGQATVLRYATSPEKAVDLIESDYFEKQK